jgi:hypothetical protein
MRCGSYAVSQVLVGLHRVGLVGLRQACEKAAASALAAREEIVDFLRAELAADNFIPEGQQEAYRTALWREYLRSVGEDFSEFFSEIPVTVRGEPGEDRDRLAGLCASVLADFELRPVAEYADADKEGPNPQLDIGGTTIARGLPSRKSLKATVRHRLSDW